MRILRGPVEVARQWADDAFIKAVITDGRDVLHVAHLGRHLAADVRTGLDGDAGEHPPAVHG